MAKKIMSKKEWSTLIRAMCGEKIYIRIEVTPPEFYKWTHYAKSHVNIKTKTNLIRYAVEQYILNTPSKIGQQADQITKPNFTKKELMQDMGKLMLDMSDKLEAKLTPTPFNKSDIRQLMHEESTRIAIKIETMKHIIGDKSLTDKQIIEQSNGKIDMKTLIDILGQNNNLFIRDIRTNKIKRGTNGQ